MLSALVDPGVGDLRQRFWRETTQVGAQDTWKWQQILNLHYVSYQLKLVMHRHGVIVIVNR